MNEKILAVRKTISFLSSMVLSGEQHSEDSINLVELAGGVLDEIRDKDDLITDAAIKAIIEPYEGLNPLMRELTGGVVSNLNAYRIIDVYNACIKLGINWDKTFGKKLKFIV